MPPIYSNNLVRIDLVLGPELFVLRVEEDTLREKTKRPSVLVAKFGKADSTATHLEDVILELVVLLLQLILEVGAIEGHLKWQRKESEFEKRRTQEKIENSPQVSSSLRGSA